MVLARIGMKASPESFSYSTEWKKAEEKLASQKDDEKEKLRAQAWNLEIPGFAKREIVEVIEGERSFSQEFIDRVHRHKKEIEQGWPKELREYVFGKVL